MITEGTTATTLSPDIQAELVEMMPVFVRTLNLVKLIGDTMTEETVAHLMQRLEAATNLLKFLEDERLPALLDALFANADALLPLLNRMSDLQRNGTLDKLLEVGEALGAVTDSLTETTVAHMTKKAIPLLELGDTFVSSSIVKQAPAMLAAVEQTVEQMKTARPEPLSVFGLLKVLKQPEVQQAMQFGLTLLQNMSSPDKK